MLEQFGIQLGVVLIVTVVVVAYSLARTAAHSVSQFREEHHDSYVDRSRV